MEIQTLIQGVGDISEINSLQASIIDKFKLFSLTVFQCELQKLRELFIANHFCYLTKRRFYLPDKKIPGHFLLRRTDIFTSFYYHTKPLKQISLINSKLSSPTGFSVRIPNTHSSMRCGIHENDETILSP